MEGVLAKLHILNTEYTHKYEGSSNISWKMTSKLTVVQKIEMYECKRYLKNQTVH